MILWSDLWSKIQFSEEQIFIRTESNIYKRKDGRWEGRYFKEYDSNGKIKYASVYGKSYNEVKEKLKIAKGYNLKPTQSQTKNIKTPFSLICQQWLDCIKNNVKISTYSRYSYIIEKYILPSASNYKLYEIDSNFTDKLISDNSYLATNSLKSILMVFNSIINYANDKYDTNIVLKNKKLKKTNSKTIRVLSTFELSRLIRFLLKDTDYLKLGVFLCLYTGLRIGEICALKWNDINLTDKEIKVKRTIQRIRNTDKNALRKTSVIIDTPKSATSFRIIPLPNSIVDLLQKYKANGYFLTGNNKFIEPRTYQNKFKKYLIEANIEEINFHTLRHTFATRAIENGFDINSLSEILGHSSVKITLEKYVHTSFEQKRKQMDKLNLLQLIDKTPSIKTISENNSNFTA